MKYIILSLILITAFSSLQAVTWSRVYGTPNEDIAHVAKQTPDDGYIVLGHTGTYPNMEAWILKLDEYGDSVWTIKFDSVISNILYASLSDFDIELYNDSGFIIVINKENSFGYFLRIIKTDKYGSIIWDNVFDIGNENSFDLPYDMDITTDGGCIIVGNSVFGNHTRFLFKTNQAGDSIWATTPGDEHFLSSVCIIPNGDFIVTDQGDYHYGKTLIKFDNTGAWINSVYYSDSWTRDIEMLSDSNYIVISGSHLFKVNNNLDSIWSRNIGGWEVEPCNDGGFVITGSATEDAYINKFNVNGDSIWTVFYGGSGDDVFYSISRTSDGGYICCGHTNSWGAGGYDYYIVKTDSLGYALGIEEQVINPVTENFNISYISNQNGNVQFNFTLPRSDNVKLEIFDLSGRLISIPISDYLSEGGHKINITFPNSGVYIYRLISYQFYQSGSPAIVAGKFLVF